MLTEGVAEGVGRIRGDDKRAHAAVSEAHSERRCARGLSHTPLAPDEDEARAAAPGWRGEGELGERELGEVVMRRRPYATKEERPWVRS